MSSIVDHTEISCSMSMVNSIHSGDIRVAVKQKLTLRAGPQVYSRVHKALFQDVGTSGAPHVNHSGPYIVDLLFVNL